MNSYNMILDVVHNIIAPGSRCTISKLLEDTIENNLIEKYGKHWRKEEQIFYSAFESIRKNFNVSNYCGDIPYLYSMYYLFLNIPKVQLVLIELMRKNRVNNKLKILDVGASVGTTAIAIMDLFSLIKNVYELYGEENFMYEIEIDSWEGSEENIHVFKKNVTVFRDKLMNCTDISYMTINDPIKCNVVNYDNDKNQYDLVIVSNLLNEITYDERLKLITKLNNKLSTTGDIVLIEPASKLNTLALNKLKNDIVDNIKLEVIAPCSNNNKCKECWNFRTSNIVKGKIYSYIDDLYSSHNISKFDDYYNNRLKWSYCILSNHIKPVNIENIDKYNLGFNKSIRLYSVDNKFNGEMLFCDGKGNKVIINDIAYKKFSFGDCINIINSNLEKNENYRIDILDNGNILNDSIYEKKLKFKYKKLKKENINFILNRLWGFSELREGQFEIIEKALQGKDILGILPTGAGKSICYQLPAMLNMGVSIVVSPLKSLIKDQVNNLHNIGFEFVDYIDSSKDKHEKDIILKRFRNGSLKLLYVSPERLQMLDFQKELINSLSGFNIDYFIIDEAHCASEWGHDFRPAYLKLKDVANRLNNCNILAVTATASPKVRADILEIFSIKEENVVFSKSLDRQELSLEVLNINDFEDKDDKLSIELNDNIPKILQKNNIGEIHKDGAGIVFTIYGQGNGTSTRPFSTTYLNELTQEWGIKSECYYSALPEQVKIDTQDRFKVNEFPLLVSTKGFGMGIDKPNIRYIIHMCYPNSLEAYYQEAGRAGRDRQHAHSVIIAKARDERCIKAINNLDTFEPPCITKWVCSYTGGNRCDYGMQAKFISDEYPSAFIMEKKLDNFINNYFKNGYLSRKHKTKFIFDVPKKNSSEFQKYLYYFQKFDLIKNYHIVAYKNSYIELGVEIDKEIRAVEINTVKGKIISRLQEFKKQKYNMLQSMWEYVKNEKQCRRQYLMNYFQDDTFYGDDGCGFCDIEGISLEKREAVRSTLKVTHIYKDLQFYFKEDKFDFIKINDLIKSAEVEKIEDSLRIRALRYLEDYTDSKSALYISSYIAIKEDTKNSFARNQVLQLIDILAKQNEYDQIIDVMDKFYSLDENLIVDLFKVSSKINSDSKFIDTILKSNCNNEIKIVGYKSFIRRKISKINDLFK